jgi:molybdopterin-guanine dinucleotide biosynthesis protein A
MDSRYGAIVLCGGESSRMGRDKAWLPWGAKLTLLQHVVESLQQIFPKDNVAIVKGHGQNVPEVGSFGASCISESRRTQGGGPLVGLMSGLMALEGGQRIRIAFACGCDAPLLKPAFVRRVLELHSDGVDAVVPIDEDRLFPLAATYRSSCYRQLHDAFIAGERSLRRLLQSGVWNVKEVPVATLRDVDSELDTLVNCNTPADYEWALKRAGLSE